MQYTLHADVSESNGIDLPENGMRCILYNESVFCNVTQSTDVSDIPDELPREWLVNYKMWRGLKIETCGHTFHPSVLSYHFIRNNMRCPICRSGNDHKMKLSSLPDTHIDTFKMVLNNASMQDSSSEEESDSDMTDEMSSGSEYNNDNNMSRHMIMTSIGYATMIAQQEFQRAFTRDPELYSEIVVSFEIMYQNTIDNHTFTGTARAEVQTTRCRTENNIEFRPQHNFCRRVCAFLRNNSAKFCTADARFRVGLSLISTGGAQILFGPWFTGRSALEGIYPLACLCTSQNTRSNLATFLKTGTVKISDTQIILNLQMDKLCWYAQL